MAIIWGPLGARFARARQRHPDQGLVNADHSHPREPAAVEAQGHTLQLAQLNAHAPELHLAVGPAQVLQKARARVEAGQVPGPVHLAVPSLVPGAGEEPLRSQVGAVQVAGGYLHAAEHQVPHLAVWQADL